MKKAFTKKFWIGSISAFVIGTGIALACAGGYWEEYGNSNFTPEVFVDAKYKPFFYSYNYYYEINYDEKHNERFNKQVQEDWYNYLDKKCPAEDLNYLLFQTATTTVDSILKGENFFTDRARNISFLKDKKNKKAAAFLNYLALAKQCETFALRKDGEVWYYDKKPEPRKSSDEICAKLRSQYNSCKDNFIKPRLAFQLVRALYFNEAYKECAITFETIPFSKNYMYYRTMAYAAGAWYKTGIYAEANYRFSLVYQANEELKTVAHWSFKPQEEQDWQQTLALCKTTEEKITLWQMLGVEYKDELRSLYEIYKLDPSSEKLDLLLNRAINKYENEKFDFDNSAKKESGIPKANKLKVFVQDLLTNKNITKPYMWEMACAYLETIDKQYTYAEDHLKLAEKTIPKDPLVKAQLRLLRLINTVSSLNKLDEKTENDLLPDITWLVQLQKDTASQKIRSSHTYSWLLKCMAKKYRQQKDLLKAEFFETTSDYYVNEKQLADMKSFLQKKDKTQYEQLCQGIYSLKYEDLVEFEAIYKTFNNKIEEAIALMEQAGEGAKKELLSNPFNGGIKDCHDCDHAQPQKIKYTKLMTLKKMKEMKEKLNADTYNNALLLANVFYNITYYGSSRLFYDCNVIGRYSYSEREYINDAFRNKLTDMTMAKLYYNIALSAAQTPEQKTKCFYMLAKCERNEWYNAGNGNEPGRDFMAWKNFTYLKQYSKTAYYKEIIKECGYFRTYTGN